MIYFIIWLLIGLIAAILVIIGDYCEKKKEKKPFTISAEDIILIVGFTLLGPVALYAGIKAKAYKSIILFKISTHEESE